MPYLTLLLKYKDLILLVVILLFVGGLVARFKYLEHENGELKEQVKQLNISLQTSNNSIKTLQSALNNQNAAIDKMKTDNDARIKAHAAELAKAQKNAETYKKRADDIMKSKPVSADKCVSADALINEEIKKNVQK